MPHTYDCRRCGACCVPRAPSDGSGYVLLDREEAGQIRRLGFPVRQGPLGGSFLACRPHDGAGGRPACAAFDGEVGGGCGCSIYPDRPSVCREFEVGDSLCREAREQAGLPV